MTGKQDSAREGLKSGEYREEIDFEKLAREEAVRSFYGLRREVENRWWEIFESFENGESVSYEQLKIARQRCVELDRMVSEFLYKSGDLTDVQAREYGLRNEPTYSEWEDKHE
jgi:hypothetical protein